MLLESEVVSKLVSDLKKSKIRDISLEVHCPYGYADILTYSTLIEVKEVRKYKEGIGQLVSYNTHFKKFKKILVLFRQEGWGKINKSDTLFNLCRTNDIYLFTYYPSKDFGEFVIKYKLDKPRTKEQKTIWECTNEEWVMNRRKERQINKNPDNYINGIRIK